MTILMNQNNTIYPIQTPFNAVLTSFLDDSRTIPTPYIKFTKETLKTPLLQHPKLTFQMHDKVSS